MYPILFRIGSVPFYTYTAALYAGALTALGLMLWQAPQRGLRRERVTWAAIWSLAGAIIGGRLAHVALHWAAYSAQPAAIWRSWGEGLAFPGALLGGLAALAGYAACRRASFWALADLGALGLAVGQAWGWLGALLHGSQYGRAVYGGWSWALPDLYGVVLPRYPTQAVALAASLASAATLWALRRQLRPGGLLALLLLLQGLALGLLQPTRGDDLAQGAQAFYLVEAGAGLALGLWTQRHVLDARRLRRPAEIEYHPSEGS